MFPCLIWEAKTESGNSFEQCEAQTAFPIWNLLRLQEELEVHAKTGLSVQGGPSCVALHKPRRRLETLRMLHRESGG